MTSRQTVKTRTQEKLREDKDMVLPDPMLDLSEDSMATVTVVLRSEILGQGDEKLGKQLLHELVSALLEWKQPPEKILFYHQAVKLTLKDSPILSSLQALQEKGAQIWVCETSLRHLTFKEPLVGSQASFAELVEQMSRATKVLWF